LQTTLDSIGQGFDDSFSKVHGMTNQIQIIAPYWLHGTWVFDDPATGLVQEPFVCGVPEMINDLVQDIPNARQGFRLLFSASPFPGFQRRLEWVREEFGGNWYRADQPAIEGWLCPALFRYFETAPAELYAKAEGLSR
jgi:hypothetical protein